MNTKRLCTLALLSATALVIFVVEAQIPLPLPVPGVKLGLSNVVTLFALRLLGRRAAGTVLLVRILLGSFVLGTLSALLYSLAGGLLCYLLMALLHPLFPDKQIFILSMLGAIAHNVGQLTVAIWVLGTPSLLYYAPALLLAALVTGFFTGHCAQAVVLHKARLKL